MDAAAVRGRLALHGLQDLAERLEDRPGHGDWQRWQAALNDLPTLGAGRVELVDGALGLCPDRPLNAAQRAALVAALQALHPWRKGPYRIADVSIDTEWRSDWKWTRVRPHLAPLDDRLILDVGCGNGYYAWRMAEEGARYVVGLDPTTLYLAQFLAIRGLLAEMQPRWADTVELLPLGVEALPAGLGCFDTVFSMGVLYHRRSPIDHLLALREALRPGGQLVLESLVVEGGPDRVLVPARRYAKMRNVWFIPSPAMLQTWLRRCGYHAIRLVDVSVTTTDEQRSTDWMRFESLADFLDPADNRLTIEGLPAPCRAVIVAEA